MKLRRAVIDTNVLYAGLYSSSGASFQLLRRIESGDLVPVLSTAILFEYEEILRRNQKSLHLSSRGINDVLDGMCLHGEYQKIHFIWRPQLQDPKDDHILELAVAAGCVDVVTHNIKDFTTAGLFGVRVVTPKKLLGELK
ncbi:MAG TPA: putative toxin-antitoxin system toxin component, PIN family [Kiritimatiellia bacterium]|nr:putative toxin-antitoxin system toxin component, PIN family [Kiritimatiellia bacterium]HMO97723.1 putative toxin-antitoxin system toxin component, PIN family [Kiritimatiellia bacterium]